MSGIELALAAAIAEAGPALMFAGEAAAAGGAAAAGTAAAAGAGAAAAGGTAASIAAEEAALIGMYEAAGMGGGEAAATGLLGAEDIAMAEAMGEGAYGGGQASGGLLSDPSSMLAQDGTGNAFMSDYDKYKHFAKEGFRSVGQGFNKLPKPAQQMVQGQAMQGLLGPQEQGPRQNFVAPQGGQQQHGSVNPYKPQQMPQATPYAPTLVGGENEKEMKRRLMLMRQMQGY